MLSRHHAYLTHMLRQILLTADNPHSLPNQGTRLRFSHLINPSSMRTRDPFSR